MIRPYAEFQHQHDVDIVRDARLTIAAMQQAQAMEAEANKAILALLDDEPEDPADSDNWLPGVDDVPDHVREGWHR